MTFPQSCILIAAVLAFVIVVVDSSVEYRN